MLRPNNNRFQSSNLSPFIHLILPLSYIREPGLLINKVVSVTTCLQILIDLQYNALKYCKQKKKILPIKCFFNLNNLIFEGTFDFYPAYRNLL